MFNRFLLLLLLQCFISHSGTPTQSVTGQKGGNSTLSCEFEARDIFKIKFYRLSKLICKKEECEHNNGTLFKKGSCDIIIKDLSFSDAGKYILRVYYTDDQTVLEPQTRKYQLHIQAETSAQKGEQLKMDVLLINADKVEKNSSGEWTEVWTRGHGVSSDRLTDRDGNLTINKFTASDAGTYRVLDSEGEILITVTVTESGTQSKEKLDRDDDKTSDTEQPTSWIIVVCVIGALLVLVISALIWKYRRQHRNTEHEPVPMQDIEQ